MAKEETKDVRARLLDCARELVAEGGAESLSIRRVAEKAGVSSGAPYWHFPDRRALLLGLAEDSFERMNAVAVEALASAADDPVAGLRRLAELFLEFSRAHPREVDLMYESELTRPIDPKLKGGYQLAYRTIVEAVTRANPADGASRNITRALVYWSSLFGLSRLIRHQLLDPFAEGNQTDLVAAMLDEIVAAASGCR